MATDIGLKTVVYLDLVQVLLIHSNVTIFYLIILVAFDSWPLLSEYPSECLHDTQFTYPNGTKAQVYSCYCQSVVDLHTKWLADYNLDGFMLQRFVCEVQTPNPALTQRNQVAQYIRQAAEKYNRVFTIMYDISGANPDTLFDVNSIFK